MPDDSPVETRPNDGFRTDHSSQPAAPTGLSGPSPRADGADDPAGAAAQDVTPTPSNPWPVDAEPPVAGAARNGGFPASAGSRTAGHGGTNGAGSDDHVVDPAPVGADSDNGVADHAAVASVDAPNEPVRTNGFMPADTTPQTPSSTPAEPVGEPDHEAEHPSGRAAQPDGVASTPTAASNGEPTAAGVTATGGGAAGSPPPRPPTGDGTDGSGPSRPAPGRKSSFLRELPILLVVAFGLALLIKTFLVQAFFIPSGSMEKTLHGCTGCSGDRVLVNKLVYRFHDPRPGDVVVFRGPESWAPEAHYSKPSNVVQKVFRAIGSAVGVAPAGEKDFVKRVIAVGGQTVQCCDTQGRVVVDGRPLDEPYVYISDPDYRSQPFGPIKVPAGRLWMMGDHRDESADSRVHISDSDQGTIGVSDVIGKAFVIVWPPSRWATLGTPSTFASAAPVATPYVLGAGLVLPVGLVRRRRRRGR
jgi:signal peptidase I